MIKTIHIFLILTFASTFIIAQVVTWCWFRNWVVL